MGVVGSLRPMIYNPYLSRGSKLTGDPSIHPSNHPSNQTTQSSIQPTTQSSIYAIRWQNSGWKSTTVTEKWENLNV